MCPDELLHSSVRFLLILEGHYTLVIGHDLT